MNGVYSSQRGGATEGYSSYVSESVHVEVFTNGRSALMMQRSKQTFALRFDFLFSVVKVGFYCDQTGFY